MGDRLRAARKAKRLFQGGLEKRTDLLRCFLSRVENGHTVPVIETLEKIARGLEVPLYQLFYEGPVPPRISNLLKQQKVGNSGWGSSGKECVCFTRFRQQLRRMTEKEREFMRSLARKMARKMSARAARQE